MGEWEFFVALLMLGHTREPAETGSMRVSVQLIVRAHGGSHPEVCFHSAMDFSSSVMISNCKC